MLVCESGELTLGNRMTNTIEYPNCIDFVFFSSQWFQTTTTHQILISLPYHIVLKFSLEKKS